MNLFVPGLPIERYNPCVDLEQSMIPHIQKLIHIENNKIIGSEYIPNIHYYYEFNYIIKQYIEKEIK